MKLNQVSANHSELSGRCADGCSYEMVFSYGRPAVLKKYGKRAIYVINMEVWQYSTSTSRHIFSTFPELRGVNPSDSWESENTVPVRNDDEFCAAFAAALGGVK